MMNIYTIISKLCHCYPLSRGRHFIFRNLQKTGLLEKLSAQVGEMTTSRYGFHIHCLAHDRVSDWLKVFGDYEKGTDAYFLSQRENKGLFLDIGSNVGFYSLLHASEKLSSKVWAFEPNPQPYGALMKSVKENKFEQLIEVFPYALSNQDGVAHFTYEPGVSGSGHLSTEQLTGQEHIEVQIKAFSNLWEEQGKPLVSQVKIDVEGHEWQVLQAMEEMLKRDHPRLVVELVDEQLIRFGASKEQIIEYLKGLGYSRKGSYELNCFFEA